MLGFCPICEKEAELIHLQHPEEIVVRGESIVISGDFYRCTSCNSEFDNPDPEYDPLDIAYEEYRKIKGMVHPTQIRDFRKKFDITQKELSSLLGLGEVTISRYENGSLQDEAHDKLLQLVMDPFNLIKLVKQKPGVFSKEKRGNIIAFLEHENILPDIFMQIFYSGISDIYTGNTAFNFNKITHMIKYFTYRKGVYKSKLMKLLFYSDFLFYKEFKTSITGLKYAHLPFGPVPDKYELLLGVIINADSSIIMDTQKIGNYEGEIITSSEPMNQSGFSNQESDTLTKVYSFFSNFTAKQIEDYSHEEDGYKQTNNGDLISYNHAHALKLALFE